MSKILIIEDEQSLVVALERGLRAEGFDVESSASGEEGFFLAQENAYDLILLDVLLPGKNGFEICEDLRKMGISTPILMLTAQSDDLDIAEGLDLGADDYLVKPFSFVVLLSRIRSLVRRGRRTSENQTLALGPFRLDVDAHRAYCHQTEVSLTRKEYAIFSYFLSHPKSVISKRELLDEFWDMNYDGDPNIIEVYIRRLRRKLDPLLTSPVIETIRGVGYRLNLDAI